MGGTFVFGRGGDSVWLDPAVVTGGESFRVTGQLLEPLFQYEDGDTAPSNVDPDNFLNYFFGGLSATGQVKKPDAREGYYANREVADPLYQAATEPAWAKRAPLYEKVERLLQPRMTRHGEVWGQFPHLSLCRGSLNPQLGPAY